MKTNPKAAVRFLSTMFARSKAPVFITSLANDRAQTHRLPPRQAVTRENKVVEHFVETWDKPERALYFCVATLKPGILRRTKDNLGEIVCLHCDIDFKDIEGDVDNVFAKVVLPVLPTITVASGHGMHIYWKLHEPLPATSGNIERVEACLRRIAYLFAGDPAVCECARLMRLPGGHNTKNGEWRGVRVRKQLGHVYKLHKLEQSFARATQLLQRRARADAPVNFFTALGDAQTFAAPVDIDGRLAMMEFHGPDEFSVHRTQLSVTAAMLTRGWSIENVVERVLVATAEAVGSDGRGWDWEQEKRDLLKMCIKWQEKHPCVVFELP